MSSFRTALKHIGLASAMALCTVAGHAQQLATIHKQKEPLQLESMGSFYVGGEKVYRTHDQLGWMSNAAGGSIIINQMYVQFKVPARRNRNPPLVLLHGSFLSSKSWETTPDGRMGWEEYLVRKGYPVYNVDQVNRARSGFDVGIFNDVKGGRKKPSELPDVFGLDQEHGLWNAFRVGDKPGTPFPDTQFPYQAMDEFAKQEAPEIYNGPDDLKATFHALSELAGNLNGAMFIGHSFGAGIMMEAAAGSPASIRGIINLEGPCGLFQPLSDEQVRQLAAIPILIVYGDHLKMLTGIDFSYQDQMKQCEAFVSRVNAIGGRAKLVLLPDLGIKGNSHMLMMDRNNLQIADLVSKWITGTARPR